MHHRFVKSYFLFFMAGIAHLIPRLFEEKLGNDAVPQVALLALFLLDGGMYIFHPEVSVSELAVTIETFFAGKGSFLGRGGAGGEVNNRAQEKQYSCCQVYTASLRGDQFGSHYGFVLPNLVYGDFCVIRQLHDPYGMMERWNNG
jgi:hypothetical protein